MTKTSQNLDDTHIPLDSPDTNTATDIKKESRLSWKNIKKYISHPILPWSLVLIILISIVATWIDHELNDHRYDRWGWDKYIHMNTYDPWYIMERKHEMMQDRFERMEREMDNAFRWHEQRIQSPISLSSWKYSSTRIIDGDTLTYTLDISSGSVSGTYSGTNSGALTTLEQSLKWLGYTVEKKESGYTFSGNTDNIQKIIELLR